MNYYEVLGVPENASQSQIRNAYISQVRLFQPDVFPGDPSIAKIKTWQLNVSYYVLHDPDRRAEYDRKLYSSVKNPPPSYSDTSLDFENHLSSCSSNIQNKKINRFIKIFGSVFLLVVVFVIFDCIFMNSKSDDSILESENRSSLVDGYKPDSAKNEDHSSPILVPSTGQILYSDGQECIAPFSVVTRGPNNYYVKLKNVLTSKDVISFFVRGGETADLDVPLGTYFLYYAAGDSWQGETDVFGESTRYFKADDVFDFYESDGYVNGWTVELYAQSSGNLSTESIDPSEF